MKYIFLITVVFVHSVFSQTQFKDESSRNKEIIKEGETLGQSLYYLKSILLSKENFLKEYQSFFHISSDKKKSCRGSIILWALSGALLGFLGAAISSEQKYWGPIAGGTALGIIVWLLTCGGTL